MYQEHSPRPRGTNPLATRRKLARERVAPYLSDLRRWRTKSIQLRALAASRHHTSEVASVDLQLEGLRKEIESVRQAFLTEMDDIRDTPAVIDFIGALDSLL